MKSAAGSAGAFERLHVGRELNQIAGDEARGESQMAQDLDQQPRRIAARSGSELERLLAGLDARLHPDHVADFASADAD